MTRARQEDLDELASACNSESSEFVVSKWIVEKVPFIFNGNFEQFIKTKLFIANRLGVDSCSVIFVGSSCTGFSMNPQKKFKLFDDDSDIDIAIISHHYFNIAWHWMRTQDFNMFRGAAKYSLKQHRSYYVFDGTIATDTMLSLLPFGAQWQAVITELKKDPIFHGRDINFRLYQDHKSLIDYHIKNIKRNLPQLLGINPMSKEIK